VKSKLNRSRAGIGIVEMAKGCVTPRNLPASWNRSQF